MYDKNAVNPKNAPITKKDIDVKSKEQSPQMPPIKVHATNIQVNFVLFIFLVFDSQFIHTHIKLLCNLFKHKFQWLVAIDKLLLQKLLAMHSPFFGTIIPFNGSTIFSVQVAIDEPHFGAII
jgi:hypothetical protein